MRKMLSDGDPGGRSERGSALIIALALVLGLTILVAATQMQVVNELKLTKGERDYERALQMAESGVNAYLNMLAKGQSPGNPLVPQPYTLTAVLTAQEFKQQAKNGTIPSAYLIHYPAGQTRQGYFAGQLGASAGTADIASYGWSGGTVRRLRIHAEIYDIFDWTAIWGINPGTGPQDYAWKFSGSVNVVGAAGAEGLLNSSNANVQIYDGPLVWANKSYAPPFNNPDLPIQNSGPNVPPAHPSTADHVHPMANPLHKHYVRPLGFPTADEAANQESGTAQGVAYFKANNNNATGLRYLVRNTTTGVIRELNDPDPAKAYTVLPNNDWELDGEFNLTSGAIKSKLKAAGMDDTTEQGYGIRVYPGHYYLEQIDMASADYLVLRTFPDADRASLLSAGKLSPVISNDTGNPNPGQGENKNVRFWIGHRSAGSDPATTFCANTEMEYGEWASRFRIYNASRGGVTVKGSSPPRMFRVNMLNYNKDANGYYGDIHFQSGTYLFGSLISWTVDSVGGCTIEKQQPELGPANPLAYNNIDWRELP